MPTDGEPIWDLFSEFSLPKLTLRFCVTKWVWLVPPTGCYVLTAIVLTWKSHEGETQSRAAPDLSTITEFLWFHDNDWKDSFKVEDLFLNKCWV